MNKKQLREKYFNLRGQLSYQEIKQKSQIIINKFVNTSHYKDSKIIMSYINMGNEIITKDLIKKGLQEKKRIIVPITDKKLKRLKLSELKDFDKELEKSTYGILEPKQEYIRHVEESILDIVIVPGLVFDQGGYRIGYGGGYYDRLIERLNKATILIGLALDCQLIDRIPNEDFDKRVTYIITESKIIKTQEL